MQMVFEEPVQSSSQSYGWFIHACTLLIFLGGVTFTSAEMTAGMCWCNQKVLWLRWYASAERAHTQVRTWCCSHSMMKIHASGSQDLNLVDHGATFAVDSICSFEQLTTCCYNPSLLTWGATSNLIRFFEEHSEDSKTLSKYLSTRNEWKTISIVHNFNTSSQCCKKSSANIKNILISDRIVKHVTWFVFSRHNSQRNIMLSISQQILKNHINPIHILFEINNTQHLFHPTVINTNARHHHRV